jgi:hypothetical protein
MTRDPIIRPSRSWVGFQNYSYVKVSVYIDEIYGRIICLGNKMELLELLPAVLRFKQLAHRLQEKRKKKSQ